MASQFLQIKEQLEYFPPGVYTAADFDIDDASIDEAVEALKASLSETFYPYTLNRRMDLSDFKTWSDKNLESLDDLAVKHKTRILALVDMEHLSSTMVVMTLATERKDVMFEMKLRF